MRAIFTTSAALFVSLSLLAAPAHGDLLAFLNFQDQSGATIDFSFDKNYLQSVPTMVASGPDLAPNGHVGVGYTDSEGTAHIAGRALAYENGLRNGTNQTLLTFDTTGFRDFSYRYDGRGTSTGSPGGAVLWRLGTSGAFTSIGTDGWALDANYHEVNRDLSALSSMNDAGIVQILFNWTAGTGSGTLRVDNFELRGQAVPEPGSLTAAVGLLGLLLRRRR